MNRLLMGDSGVLYRGKFASEGHLGVAVCSLADDCLAARSLGVNGRLRIVRWRWCSRLFQRSPELRGSAAVGGGISFRRASSMAKPLRIYFLMPPPPTSGIAHHSVTAHDIPPKPPYPDYRNSKSSTSAYRAQNKAAQLRS